jgi:hypothetical protein
LSEEKESRAKSRRKALAKYVDYQKVFNDPIGKKVLHDMMHEHFLLKPTFVKGDPHQSALHEGERNVILRLLAILKVDPMLLEQKLKESEGYDE